MRHRGLGLTALAAVVVMAASGASARGQFFYPPGYGGWQGWGGGQTAFGDAARGMGVFAAGAGAYNLQTAEGRSINVDTNMRLNEYLWQSQQVRNQRFYQQQAARQERNLTTSAAIYNRLRNNPERRDVHSGDALNLVLDDLTDPSVYVNSLKGATLEIPSSLVKSIPFRYASQGITISLSQLTREGVPDVIRTTPELTAEREALRAIYEQARAEVDEKGEVSPETLAKGEAAAQALLAKVNQVVPAGPNRRAADNFLKALLGLTRMLRQPNLDGFLRQLDTVETTTLGHLLGFMQAFNLRFGVANGAAQTSTYDRLFPMLVALRDGVNPKGSDTMAVRLTPDDHAKVTEAFADMKFEHFEPQPPPEPGVDQ